MSGDDLTTLLADLADDVTHAHLVAPALDRARRVRRRRVVTGAVAVVAVALVGAGATALPRRPDAPVAAPSPSTVVDRTGRFDVVQLPATVPVDGHAAPYWPSALRPPANTRWLADSPLSHAVLLYLPPGLSDAHSYVYAYGEIGGTGSFTWVKVPVGLVDTTDGANRAVPLDATSLGPMGVRAAFAQPDGVVVVDVRTGDRVTVPVPGLNEEVTWLADGVHLLVVGDHGTSLVDVDRRTVVPVAVSGWSAATLVGGGAGLSALTLDDSGTQPPVLHTYDDAGRAETGRHVVAGDDRLHVSYLYGRAWRYGPQLVQAAGGQLETGPAEFVLTVDERTSRITHVLDLGGDRPKGCCAVLGWLDPYSVLVSTGDLGLLRWTVGTGAVTRLTQPWDGTVSIAPTGCDWSVTIDGVTATCTP